METVIADINKTHPGYDIYLDADDLIVVDKHTLNGVRTMGKFKNVDDLFDYLTQAHIK